MRRPDRVDLPSGEGLDQRGGRRSLTRPTVVINVVGLSESLLGDSAPNLCAFAGRGSVRRLRPVLPAVTCSVQSSMLTGLSPAGHGIVGNGWYNRELAEVQFWKQSNRLVQGEKVWETARGRDGSVTACNMFWWYNMYSSADVSVTPRPMYKADGRKIPDVYSEPPELRPLLQQCLGRFPLFRFWGPAASIDSSRWIADASILVHERYAPALTLVYLPHLDYGLQKLGPEHPEIPRHVAEIDAVVGRLLEYFGDRGVRVVIVSEYGIEPVDSAIDVNCALRREGALRVRDEEGHELLDAGASRAFAVADHQVAHVYVRDPAQVERFRAVCEGLEGVELVLDRAQQAAHGIDHERAGELVLVAAAGFWFNYAWWLDDSRAPDFARTVDIHRKPGYDPLELFVDPKLALPKLRIAGKLARRRLGMRTLLDVIPLDTSLVKGSHGRVDNPAERQPLLITQDGAERPEELPCQAVRDVILETLFGE